MVRSGIISDRSDLPVNGRIGTQGIKQDALCLGKSVKQSERTLTDPELIADGDLKEFPVSGHILD